MAKINPNDDKWNDKNKGGISPCGSGVKDFSGIGFEHFSINGKSVVEVRSICINDTTNKSDEGNELRDLFFLHSDGAISRFVKFAKDGCGWNEPFDPEDAEDVARIIGNRPFRAKVKAKQNGEYVQHDCGWSYEAPGLEVDPATGNFLMEQYQIDAIESGTKAWDGYVKWRGENPREGGGAAGSGGSGGGGNSTGGGGGGGGGDYGDIPF